MVIDSGSVPEALRASISFPGIFTLVKRGGQYLVDGGLTTPVPVHIVRRMGADFIIAVNVNPDINDRKVRTVRQNAKARKEPNIFQVMMQSIYITTYSLVRGALEDADIVVEPPVAHIGAGDFQKAHELIKLGALATRYAVPEIKKKLGE